MMQGHDVESPHPGVHQWHLEEEHLQVAIWIEALHFRFLRLVGRVDHCHLAAVAMRAKKDAPCRHQMLTDLCQEEKALHVVALPM